jgi:hypothetical protein
MNESPMTTTAADKYYRTSAMIAGALIIGQLAFAGVAWFLYNSGSRVPSGEELLNVLTYVWIGLSFGVLAMGFVMRQRIVADAEQQGLVSASADRTDPAQVQTRVITTLAMLESAGLLGIAVYFIQGHPQVLYAAVGYIVIAAIFFFPRREWFGPR